MMFSRRVTNSEEVLLVRLVTADRVLEQRVREALAATQRYHIESLHGTLTAVAGKLGRENHCSLLILDLRSDPATDLATLQALLATWSIPPAIIVMSDRLGEADARRFLKLQISDWLPKQSTPAEIAKACQQALEPSASSGGADQAYCIAFFPAIGGAGTTTLSLAAASVLGQRARSSLEKCCVVDLDFQSGSVTDHLDLTPNLQLSEIASSPERLDAQLLEVMLSRHASGLAVLAAPPSLTVDEQIDAHLIGRLLDLVSSRFRNIVIDMPRAWTPWSDSVVRGANKVFIVTEMTVAGLRQASRTAEMLEQKCGIATTGSIIVNKCPWFSEGIKKSHVRQSLGERLALILPDCRRLTREAQNRGVLLSEVKRSNKLASELRSLLGG